MVRFTGTANNIYSYILQAVAKIIVCLAILLHATSQPLIYQQMNKITLNWSLLFSCTSEMQQHITIKMHHSSYFTHKFTHVSYAHVYSTAKIHCTVTNTSYVS